MIKNKLKDFIVLTEHFTSGIAESINYLFGLQLTCALCS